MLARVFLFGLFMTCLHVAQAQERKFYMVLRTDHDTTAHDVQLLLRAGLDSPKVVRAGVKGEFLAPRITPPEVYHNLLEWMHDVSTTESILGGALRIRRFDTNSTDWLLNLGVPDNSLIELEVTSKVGNNDATTNKFVQGSSIDSPLRYHSQGRYVLTLPVDAVPTKYKAKIRDGKTGESVSAEGDWPLPDNYYFVKFTSFSGDEKVLYDALKSGEAGNKVHQIEETKGIEIVLADFLPQQVQKGISWEKNRMTVREEMPEGAGVLARVWMQFPMPKEEATRRWQELSKLQRDEVSQRIRTEPHVAFGTPAKLLPKNSDPSWFELAPVKNAAGAITHFERSFEFEDVATWKNVTNDAASRLVVFEGDNGKQQYAVNVNHPVHNRNTFVVDKEIPNWVSGVREQLK
ncbi:MAG: hypothetical protein SFV81_03940 [Pirellulaceae bacterium]|nr:hypothetical protein [Pirellulaceae bacterium]